MKNILTKLALLSIVLTLGFSCSESKSLFSTDSDTTTDNNGNATGDDYGKLSLDITTITDITTTKSDDDSSDELLLPLSDFVVTIYNSDESQAYACAYDDIPNVIGLPVGEGYLVAVTAGTDQSAAFDSPYYYGDSEFKIVADYINTVAVESALANTRITLELSTSFTAAYGDDWEITIRNEEYVQDGDQQLVYTPSNISAIGYIRPSNLYITVRAGSVSKSYEIGEVNGAEHHILAVDIQQSGYANFSITINNTLVEKEVDLNVPSDDETLGDGGVSQPDFVPEVGDGDSSGDSGDIVVPTAPTITGSGFDITETFTYSKSDPSNVICLIDVPGGIANLNVTIDSDEINGLLTGLFEGDSFDMANPTDQQRISLESIGLLEENEDITGLTSVTFDVTGFMSLLGTNDGNTHNFTLEVIDAYDQSDKQTLKVLIAE